MNRIPTLILLLIAVLLLLSVDRPLVSQSPPPPTTELPVAAPWVAADLTTAANPGSSRAVSANFRLTSSGPNVSGTKDGGHFLHQPATGDVSIVTRIVSIAGPGRTAGGGLMIRSALDPDAPHAYLGLTASNGLAFVRRETRGAISDVDAYRSFPSTRTQRTTPSTARQWSEGTNAAAIVAAPLWLKLVRRGADVAAWASSNGSNWQWIGTERIHLPPQIIVGLTAAGGASNQSCAVLFDQVRLQPLPLPLTNAAPNFGNGIGLLGTLTDDLDTNGVQRLNATVNFGWGRRSPAPGIGNRSFAGVWEGFIEPPTTESYAFSVVHDDDARLWIGDQLLIDDTGKVGLREAKAVLTMNGGVKYPLRLEYKQGLGSALLKLRWSSPTIPTQIIPRSQLHPPLAYDPLKTGPPGFPFDLSEGLEALQAVDRVAALSAPWLSRAFRPATNHGTAVQVTEIGLRLTATGSLTGRGVDDGRFVYQPWNGDVQLIARVRHDPQASPNAKAGLMIRQSLQENDSVAFLALSHRGPTQLFQRLKPGNQTQPVRPPRVQAEGSADTGPPELEQPWLRLVRRGDNLAAYASADGSAWSLLGVAMVPLEPEIFVGMALGSGTTNVETAAAFDFIQVSIPPPLTPVIGAGDGLAGAYFGSGGADPVFRVDPQINFFWARSAPADDRLPGQFHARWEGLLEAQFSDTYTLQVVNDGAVRLWLDGRLILRGANGPRERPRSIHVNLRAGHRYPIKLEYVPHGHLTGAGRPRACRLLWSSPDTAPTPIPQTQLYSTATAAYAAVPDQDRDQMPDRWEVRHGLDPFDNADAAADPDNDGLSNLREFQAGTDPRRADSDGDGLPDAWELLHRLNPLIAADARFDRDHDGLSNRAEFDAGTSPDQADSDVDGLTDSVELGMNSNPLTADTTGVQTIAETAGAAAVAGKQLGRWQRQGGALAAIDLRGSVEYEIAAPTADLYRLEIEAGPARVHDRNREFELLVWVDDEYLGRFPIQAGAARANLPASGVAHVLTPWLPQGIHRVRVYWDNAVWNRTFQISAVRLQSLLGPDANGNGVKDWVEKRLRATCAVEVAPASSAVSPVCLEGRGRHLSMLRLTGQGGGGSGDAAAVTPRRAPGDRWYADLPLSVSNVTTVVSSFENGALRVTNQIAWRPTNLLLQSGPLRLRAGDALLLEAFPAGSTQGFSQIQVEGVTNYAGPVGQPFVHRFAAPGTFRIVATWSSRTASSVSATVTVHAVAASLGADLAAWVGKWRGWHCALPSEAVLETDPKLLLESGRALGGGTNEYWLNTSRPETSSIIARLGTNGPVLGAVSVHGFNLFSGYETAVRRVESLDDGGDLIEMGLVLSPIPPAVTIRIDLNVGGVLFEDGILSRELTATDFNALGQATVRFLRPPLTKTSVCHRTRALQASFLLGMYP